MRRPPATRSGALGSSATPWTSWTRRLLTLAALAACCVLPACTRDDEGPRRFGVYAVWFEGVRDEDAGELDAFLTCLLEGSNLASFWGGAVDLSYRGAVSLPAPERELRWDALHRELDRHGASGALPEASQDETPLYVVVSSLPAVFVGACGRSIATRIDGREAGIALVRNHPLCWPTGDRLRNETQTAMHEIVEVVDQLLGNEPCAPHGGCGGTESCPLGCEAFVGLSCPGAPEASWTGCQGGQVQGWVVQRLATAGRQARSCDPCLTCDFTPRACAEGEADCP